MTSISKIPAARKRRAADLKDDHVHVDIGRQLSQARLRAGLSPEQLAVRARISVERLLRHENGNAPISARELFQLSRILAVPISLFFRDLPTRSSGPEANGANPPTAAQEVDEAKALVQAFAAIGDDIARHEVLALVRVIAAELRRH